MITAEELKKVQTEIHNMIEKVGLTQNDSVYPIYDGVYDIDLYLGTIPRIMWVLKEPVDEDGGGWEIMKHIASHPDKSCRVPTWRKMIKTSYGIINHQPWNEELFRHIDRKMVKTVEKIAYINLSKMPGDKRSVDSKLKKNYSLWRNILFEQIEAYDPQIIIFGNTFKFFKEDMIGLDIEPIKIGGYLDIYERNGVLLFDAYHPSSPKFSNDCIKSIIEVSLKRYC